MNAEDQEPERTVDLHGLTPEAALRRLSQELHVCRVRGDRSLLVVTGRGWGNREGLPKLRVQVEAWLKAPAARSMGVQRFEIVAKGGALLVHFGA